jgi:hypothetical protein
MLPVVPLKDIEFPLVRPVFDPRNIAMTYWIVSHVIPFFFVRFCAAQLAVPKFALPKLESASGSSIRVSRDFSNTRSISSAIGLEKY